MHSLINFLFRYPNSLAEVNAVNNYMAILEENQDVLSDEMQKTFNFVNLTYAETNTNQLLLKSLQKDTLQVKQHSSLPIKGTESTFPQWIFLYQFVTITKCFSNTLKWNKFSQSRYPIILNKFSVISSQTLTLTLLNPPDLKLLLTN